MKKQTIISKNTGFTFLEVLVATGIFAIVSAMFFMSFYSGFMLFNSVNTKMQLQQEVRKAIDAINFELRKTAIDKVTIDGTYPIEFVLPESKDDLIETEDGLIQWSDATVNFHIEDGKLIKTVEDQGGGGPIRPVRARRIGHGRPDEIRYGDFVVANYINEITFIKDVINKKVTITVSATRGLFPGQECSFSMSSFVKLRN